MENKKTIDSNTSDRELLLTRTLSAPIKLVWEVWTDPAHIKNWWGPNGFYEHYSQNGSKGRW
jgi:uncharacterized protein YndB with AHSA1/START domain